MAYDLVTDAPEAAGLSSARLARLDRHLAERYIDPGRLPGALTLVHRRGRTVHLSVQGLADRERRAVGQVYQEGRLQAWFPVAHLRQGASPNSNED